MRADQIFVLVLVVGIVLGLAWVSMDSRRRAALERQRQEQAAAEAAESPAAEAAARARPERRPRRKH